MKVGAKYLRGAGFGVRIHVNHGNIAPTKPAAPCRCVCGGCATGWCCESDMCSGAS